MRQLPGILALPLSLCALAACATHESSSTARDDPSVEPTVVPSEAVQLVGYGESIAPAESVADWRHNADVIVAFRVVDENPSGYISGRYVMRAVTAVVVDGGPLWRSDDAIDRKFPAEVTLNEFGWRGTSSSGAVVEATADDVRGLQPVGLFDAARVQVGHTYVAPFYWQPRLCGEDAQPAQFDLLGSSAVLPFDGGIVGNGEFEGSTVTVEEYLTQVATGSMARTAAGADASGVVSILEKGEGVPEVDWRPRTDECSQ